MTLDDFMNVDPTDIEKLALRHFRDRVSCYLEHHHFETDDPDGHDWASEITREAVELRDRGPVGYLQYVAEGDAQAARARLQRDFQDVIDGISLTGADRPTRNISEQE